MNNEPEDIIRDKELKARIWKNEGDYGPYYSTTFARTYTDKDGHPKDSSSFSRDHLPRISRLSDKAHDRIIELSQSQELGHSQNLSEEREDSRKASFQARRSERTVSQDRGIQR